MSHSASQQQEMVRASITQQTHMDASTKARAHTHTEENADPSRQAPPPRL